MQACSSIYCKPMSISLGRPVCGVAICKIQGKPKNLNEYPCQLLFFFFRPYLVILPYSLSQSTSTFLNANFLTDMTIIHRIFELFMAFDALRLRNIIQLIGLLSDSIILIS